MNELVKAMQKVTTLDEATKRIELAIEQGKRSIFRIAETLASVNDNKLLADTEYKSLAEYAQERFGFKKAYTYSLAKVGSRFIEDGTSIIAHDDADYTAGQLQELLPLTNEQAQELDREARICPTTPAREIREIVKAYLYNEEPESEELESEELEQESEEPEIDYAEKIRETCIANNFCTSACNETYSKILTLRDFREIVLAVWLVSDAEPADVEEAFEWAK